MKNILILFLIYTFSISPTIFVVGNETNFQSIPIIYKEKPK